MNKKLLLEQLIQLVSADLEKARLAARASSEGATHEENKAEGSKDMRATEASYLARGQAMRVEELEELLNRLHFLPLHPVSDTAPIRSGTLICLESESGDSKWYWMVPGAAGYELDAADAHPSRITTITPQSPLGAAMLEHLEGDAVELFMSGQLRQFDIVKVE